MSKFFRRWWEVVKYGWKLNPALFIGNFVNITIMILMGNYAMMIIGFGFVYVVMIILKWRLDDEKASILKLLQD